MPEWVTIDDFSPGIHHRLSPSWPRGAAQEDGTYRCHANHDNSLAPLPALTSTISYPTPSSPPANVAPEFRITGIATTGPHYWQPEASPGVDENHTEIFLGIEYWTSTQLALRTSRYLRHYANNPGWQTVWGRTISASYAPEVRPRNTFFATQWSNHPNPDKAGPYVLGWVVSGNGRYFPDDSNTGILTTRNLPGDVVDDPVAGGLVSPSALVAHQGRFVIFPLYISPFGPGSVFISSECAYWTAVNDARTLEPELVTAGTEHLTLLSPSGETSGFGLWASLAANELFAVKIHGGAVVVRGDLSDPTVDYLPYVRSTGLAFNNGTSTHLGHLYPVDAGGVWQWAGGETSEHISPMLDPDFWRPAPYSPARGPNTQDRPQTLNAFGHANTQCATSDTLSYFPNNWIFDLETPGWWRIENPELYTIHRWAGDAVRGRYVYGCPSGFSTSSDPAVYEFSTLTPSPSYTWRSHPLAETIDRRVRVEEVALTATGEGEIFLRVSSEENPDGQTFRFPISSSRYPHTFRAPARITGTHVTLSVESSTDLSSGAPVIHNISTRLNPASRTDTT